MKLEEITNQLYAEGVERGKNEAQALIAQAEQQALEIKNKAEQEAAAIIAKAQAKAAELDKNTRSELHMFAQQSVNALRTEVANLVCGRIVEDSVKAASADAKFMQSIILMMAQQMVKEGNVVIEAKDADALKAYFAAQAKEALNQGIEIKSVKDLKTDFVLKAVKGGYQLSFGDAEFEAYFRAFIRPQLMDLLF